MIFSLVWKRVEEGGESVEQATALLLLTDCAASEIKAMMTDQEKPDAFLRVGVVAGGCSGKTYQLAFETKANAEDLSFYVSGIRILVDPKSALFLSGLTLDFSRDLVGGGFKFINPNAKQSCGCGESFSA